MSVPMTDVVLTVRNALDFVKVCVGTLYEHTQNFRLIVVDDHSDVETREWLYGPECTGRDPRNLYLRHNKRRWFTRTSNNGLRLVETPRAVLLNSDVVLNDGWLEELYGVWEEAERVLGRRVGVVGDWGDPGSSDRWRETREPNYVTGHCLLLSIEAMQDISVRRGDPGRYFCETRQDCIHISSDRIGCYELNNAGWATIVAHKTPCGHYGGKSWGYDLGTVQCLRLEDVD